MSFDLPFDGLADTAAPTSVAPAAALPGTLLPASPQPGEPFAELGLAGVIAGAVHRAGYTQPTPVQARAVPAALAGADLLVSSRTGSGKTAAFILPALQCILNARASQATMSGKLARRPEPRAPQTGHRGQRPQAGGSRMGPKILVLAPTRELAQQVARAAVAYGRNIPGLRVATVVGGVPYGAQLKALRDAPDLLVATPGRLMDLMGSGAAALSQVSMFVLDEADRMLDMGFIDDIRFIADALPAQRQTLMFSATFGGHVGTLARALTREPQRIEVDSQTVAHASIEQRLHWADGAVHKHKLLEHVLADRNLDQAVVFTSTQRDADEVAQRLAEIGHAVAALHGGMPQGRRNRVLTALRQRQLRVLVATDVAARGIDVPTITHVINHGLPMKEEDYVHRIGRTGRASRNGLAITLADRRDAGMVRRIERFTHQTLSAQVIPGLEPRTPTDPRSVRPPHAPRPQAGRQRPGGFGGKPGPRRPR